MEKGGVAPSTKADKDGVHAIKRRRRKEAMKAATTGAIGGVTKLAKAIYKVDVGDFIEGVGEIAKTGAGLAWDADILAAKNDVTGIKTAISGKKIEQYLNSYTNALSQSDTALDQATTAHSAWQTAMHTRAAANRDMAAAIEKAAGASGRSEADAKNLGLAVRAAPKMEQIVGACERLLPLLALPPYTEESGAARPRPPTPGSSPSTTGSSRATGC